MTRTGARLLEESEYGGPDGLPDDDYGSRQRRHRQRHNAGLVEMWKDNLAWT
jgi:hypothetical protein